jgi:hypothetical protein
MRIDGISSGRNDFKKLLKICGPKYICTKPLHLKLQISPTYTNFGRPLKSCDIILSIEILTYFPIMSNQV